MADIYEILEEEHRNLLQVFDRIIAGNARNDDLFDEAREMFTDHKDAEEDVLYSRLEVDPELRPLVLQARVEHHAASVLMRETDWLTFDDERWVAKVKVLREMIHNHVQREEGLVFEGARLALSMEESDLLGDRYLEEEAA